jgi:hypothetical protein
VRSLVVPDDIDTPRESSGERFDRAAAAVTAARSQLRDAADMEALATARIEGMGEVPYGSNAVFLLQLEAPDPAARDQPMRAVYKPARGERPLWDFPRHTLYLREVATYFVDAALGLGHVPATALRDGPFGPGSAQLFVHPANRRPSTAEAADLEMQLRDVAMLDVLVNNADRKRSHLLVTTAMCIAAIDNALTFLPYPRQRTALLSFGGSQLPQRTAQRVRDLARDAQRLDTLRAVLSALLSGREVTAFTHRVRELAADPTYPVLDDWDGRPFEWW